MNLLTNVIGELIYSQKFEKKKKKIKVHRN